MSELTIRTLSLSPVSPSSRAPVASLDMTAAWRTLAITAIAVFMVSLDTTILFVAFPSIRWSFPGVSPSALSWILNAYTIGYGALLVPTGRLADRFGRRRLFLAGVAIFTLASALCGAAPGVDALVASRALQSIGAALLMPASLALVLDAFPRERRGIAIGIWGAVGALAAALGPAVGSAIVQFASWRWAFLLNVPMGAYAVYAGATRLAAHRGARNERIPDVLGVGLLIAAFGFLAYGILAAGEDASRAPAVLGVGAVLLIAFIWRSLLVETPAVNLRLFGY